MKVGLRHERIQSQPISVLDQHLDPFRTLSVWNRLFPLRLLFFFLREGTARSLYIQPKEVPFQASGLLKGTQFRSKIIVILSFPNKNISNRHTLSVSYNSFIIRVSS